MARLDGLGSPLRMGACSKRVRPKTLTAARRNAGRLAPRWDLSTIPPPAHPAPSSMAKKKTAPTEVRCDACNGTGFAPVIQPARPGRRVYPPACKVCGGKGCVPSPVVKAKRLGLDLGHVGLASESGAKADMGVSARWANSGLMRCGTSSSSLSLRLLFKRGVRDRLPCPSA